MNSSKDEEWAELINNLYKNEESLNYVSKRAHETIANNYSLKFFQLSIKDIEKLILKLKFL